MARNQVTIGTFLTERKVRLKPIIANEMNLPRIDKIDFSGNIHLSQGKPTKTDMILVKTGDLVISGINVEKGALAVYEGEQDVLATIHYSSYLYDEAQIDIAYFKWFLKSSVFKEVLLAQTKGGIKTEIKPKHFLALVIMLPTLEEQQAIVKKLESVQTELTELLTLGKQNQRYIVLLKEAILQEAIQGKLVPQDPNNEPANVLLKRIAVTKRSHLIDKKSIPYDVPENWEWVNLNDLLERNKDITYGIVKMGHEPREGVFTLRCSDVKYRYIDTLKARKVSQEISEQYNRTILKGGEIVMNIRGTLGGCAIVPSSLSGFNIAREIALIPISNEVNNRYVLDVLSSPYIQKNTLDSLRGIAYKGLNLNLLRNFLVPLPPLAEQQRIVAKVEELMALCDALEAQLAQQQANATALLNSLVYELVGVGSL
jgi:type I restriction enzyme S subunit